MTHRAMLVVCCLLGARSAAAQDTSSIEPRYWRKFVLGTVTSLAVHEAGHVGMSLALGARPTFGFVTGRPTIFSGIDERFEPHKQFLFSAAGLSVQTLLNEAILDIPHRGGGAFERGVLGGGFLTTAFYLTIGRTGSVSDIAFMAKVHGMTKTQSTFLFGGIMAEQVFRVSRMKKYANFFARPEGKGVRVGVSVPSPGN